MSEKPKHDPVHPNLPRYHIFRYYDAPDGEDLFGKLLNSTSLGAIAGLLIGGLISYEVRPKYSVPTVERFKTALRYSVPFAGIPAAFTITTYYSTKFRGKDDEMNYVYGGIASGLVVGAALKRPSAAIFSSAVFSLFGYSKKQALLQNKKREIHPTRALPRFVSEKLNFTVTKHRPGNWTSVKPE